MTVDDGYRSLLAAYPARLRRRYGTELITTMLEMAGPEGRPTRAARRHVVLDGLRERFRLPAGRPVAVLAAVLALLIGGALGAAVGSYVGAFTYAALPDPGALASRVLEPGGTPIVGSGGGTYLTIADDLAPGTDPVGVAQRVRQRLIADGWVTSSVALGDGSDGILPNAHFRAVTGDVELSIFAYRTPEPMLRIAGWPVRPAAYLWLIVGGLLLGMAGGWLLAASAAHRIVAARRQVSTALLGMTGLLLLLLPAIGFAVSLVRYLGVTDPIGYGGLVQAGDWSFTFGPSRDLIRALGIEGYLAQSSSYEQMTLLGMAALVVATILARPRTAGETAANPVSAAGAA